MDRLSGSELEDKVAEAFRRKGYMVWLRKNRCDILAVRDSIAYLVECKNYVLSSKQQRLAVRQLNRNYTKALEILLRQRVWVNRVLKVLVANGFAYQARGILQYTPEEFLEHVEGRLRSKLKENPLERLYNL
ncbi:MAG: restriction endonuclease [Candidatus Bathyarchaeota archaeon]|nr:restriction endonuclease [Candidatus Bathyarchaeota archaeon]